MVQEAQRSSIIVQSTEKRKEVGINQETEVETPSGSSSSERPA